MATRSSLRRTTPRSQARAAGSTAQDWVIRFGGEAAKRLDLRSDLQLAEAVEKGLPTHAIDEAVKNGIVEQEVVYRFVVPKRTLQRRRDAARPLSTDESDKLTRLVRTIARAEIALGDPKKAEVWIREPNRALQGKRPLDLLNTDVGARAVEKVLGRIEHGIFS